MRLIQLMAYTSNWKPPAGNIDLLTEDVHVWSALLDVQEDVLHVLQQTLDANEQIRAERFYFEAGQSTIYCQPWITADYFRFIYAY